MGQQDDSPQILWRPQPGIMTQMDLFRQHISSKYSLSLSSYNDLYKWSIDENEKFWSEFWHFSNLIYSKPYSRIVEKEVRFEMVPKWFTDSLLNYSENVLERGSNDSIAVLSCNEVDVLNQITFSELKTSVKRHAVALRNLGVKPGDRVVGLLPNTIQTLYAYLACIATGAIWSCASPDFGSFAIIQRFSQIQPVVLFAVDAVKFNGKTFDQLEKLSEILNGLVDLRKVVLIDSGVYAGASAERIDAFCQKNSKISVKYEDFLSGVDDDVESFEYAQVPFDHPMVILYSSGTTGIPKVCMRISFSEAYFAD